MPVLIDADGSKPRAVPRLMQILRVLTRHQFLSALFGRGHWPTVGHLPYTNPVAIIPGDLMSEVWKRSAIHRPVGQ